MPPPEIEALTSALWKHRIQLRSQGECFVSGHKKLTLQTVHHVENAQKVIAWSDKELDPPMKIDEYHRPGAPRAGLMTYARMEGMWLPVGWVREANRQAVEEMAEGDLEGLEVVLMERYMKKGYPVLKVELFCN
ncbi:hypothetical protein Bbelb_196310 [Branchiostoma belcheri]|nr:hypothetical protein Bbelb_196310 [Branchiostoma belcheri]